jgi:hypothetical protein
VEKDELSDEEWGERVGEQSRLWFEGAYLSHRGRGVDSRPQDLSTTGTDNRGGENERRKAKHRTVTRAYTRRRSWIRL